MMARMSFMVAPRLEARSQRSDKRLACRYGLSARGLARRLGVLYGRMAGNAGVDFFEAGAEALLVGDLDGEAGAGVGFEEQRTAVGIDDDVAADIAEANLAD